MFLITYGKSQCDWTSLMPKNAYTVKQKKKKTLKSTYQLFISIIIIQQVFHIIPNYKLVNWLI